MDDNIKQEAYVFHKTMSADLCDRGYDEASSSQVDTQIDKAFEKSFGEEAMNERVNIDLISKVKSRYFDAVEKGGGFVEGDKMYYMCSFVYLKYDQKTNIFPLFWNYSKCKNITIIDGDGRTYRSFQDFLDNNKLAKCFMIYPTQGKYETDLKLASSWSRSSRTGAVVARLLDYATLIGAVAGGAALCMLPMVGLPLMVANAVFIGSTLYQAGRGIAKAIDVHHHDGGFNYKNPKAIAVTADLLFSAAGLCTLGAANVIKCVSFKAGQCLAEGSKRLGNIIQFLESSFRVVSCGGTVMGVVLLALKHDQDKVETSDCQMLSKQIMFSLHSNVPISLVQMLIAEAAYIGIDLVTSYLVETKIWQTNFAKTCNIKIRKFKAYTLENYAELRKKFLPCYTKMVKELLPVLETSKKVYNSLNAGRNDLANYIYTLFDEMKKCYKSAMDSVEFKRKDINASLGNDNWDEICKWSAKEGKASLIGVGKKIRIAEAIKDAILEASSKCEKNDEYRKNIFSLMLNLLQKQGNVKDSEDALIKITYYCEIFNEELTNEFGQRQFDLFCEETECVYNDLPCSVSIDKETVIKESFSVVKEKMINNADKYRDIPDKHLDVNKEEVYEFVYPQTTDMHYRVIFDAVGKKLTEENSKCGQLNELTIVDYHYETFSIFVQPWKGMMKGVLVRKVKVD